MESFIVNKENAIKYSFGHIAGKIINKSHLIINNKEHRICEIEFYVYCKKHLDNYVHKTDDQLNYGFFYFHRYKNGTYKEGTYKGVDITLGNGKNMYYGILIRSIMRINDSHFIEGPCRCMNYILEQFNCDKVIYFVNDKYFNSFRVTDNKNPMYICDALDLRHETLHRSPRIGLSDKYPEYQHKEYRYAIYINLIKKKNGLTAEYYNRKAKAPRR
jgi:hypothetical protein